MQEKHELMVIENPIMAMVKTCIEKGLTAENTEAMKGLYELCKDQELVCAKQEFFASMSMLQAELPPVMATKSIPSKNGTVRSVFAPYEEIMGKVGPYLVRYGFSVSFTMNFIPPPPGQPSGGRMEAVCKLMHKRGHSEENKFSVRVGSGPPGCSEAQSDGSARSYARRGALCDALNIVIDKDTDAHLEGACISADAARDLAARAKDAGIDEKAFLRLAGADGFATIREHKLPILEQVLREKKKSPPAAEPTATPPADAELESQRKKITDLCKSGAMKWHSHEKTVLARTTKNVLGDSMLLGELSLDQAIAVREALEQALKE